MQKITPFLWFDSQAEEAARFYVSIFKNSKINNVTRYEPPGQGTVVVVDFHLEGQEFVAMSAGPLSKFNESISFVANCDTQEEVDYFWKKLTADGGEESMCGWLKDKFGLSWQVVPKILNEMLKDKDANKSQRVMKAMLEMRKIDIATLKRAYEGQ